MRSLFLKTILTIAGIILVQLSFAEIPPGDSSNASSNQNTSEISPDDPVAIPLIVPDLVSVGDPGNQADVTGYGAVATSFQIGRNCVKVSEYAAMLNAVAASDPYDLYSKLMGAEGNNAIEQKENNGKFQYIVTEGKENDPIGGVSWLSAIRYCNWLHNGQPRGEEDALTTESGAYTLALATDSTHAITPNADAKYFLPDENQWYKTAFYNGGQYPSYDLSPHDSPHEGYYGSMEMMFGRRYEWIGTLKPYSPEVSVGNSSVTYYTAFVLSGDTTRDGKFSPAPCYLDRIDNNIGFRIAAPAADPKTDVVVNKTDAAVDKKDPVVNDVVDQNNSKHPEVAIAPKSTLSHDLVLAGEGAAALGGVAILTLAFGPEALTYLGMEGSAATLSALRTGACEFCSTGAAATKAAEDAAVAKAAEDAALTVEATQEAAAKAAETAAPEGSFDIVTPPTVAYGKASATWSYLKPWTWPCFN